MNITVFLNELGLGGTGKAAVRWACGLRERGHELNILTLEDGPRRGELESCGIEVRVTPEAPIVIRDQVRSLKPDVIHVHAPGHPHRGDVLGLALSSLPKIPVLQTNTFGQLENPKEDSWTDFRLFVSWTSCVQAARRYFRRLDSDFFRKASVAINPLDPIERPAEDEIRVFRSRHGIDRDDTLFGRISRPEPNKWTDLLIAGFRKAAVHESKVKLLLREPPPDVIRELKDAPDQDRFIILAATNDANELRRTMASFDVVLHTSRIGESFGYGIAEPMNLGKPVITNSIPWLDQAQLELVRDGECGFIASTPRAIASKIALLANDQELRDKLGLAAQRHIRTLTDPARSLNRLEVALAAVAAGEMNPHIDEDIAEAKAAAQYLDAQQFGHTWEEQLALRPFHYRVRLHQLRKRLHLPVRRR